MKTLRIITSIIAIALAAFVSCSKEEASIDDNTVCGFDVAPLVKPTVFLDEFNNPDLSENWEIYGRPEPSWVPEADGREGLLCVNGNYPYYSYCISKQLVGAGQGYEIESEVAILKADPSGKEVAIGIGVCFDSNPVYSGGEIESGIEMKLVYYGSSAWWAPEKAIGHAWLSMYYVSFHGTKLSLTLPQNVDYLLYSWHTMKILVDKTNKLTFLVDGVSVWDADESLLNSLSSQRHLFAGFVSPDNSNAALHNYIKCSYPQSNSQTR